MLSPKQPLTALHPEVRIDSATREQFARLCKKAGTSSYAGIKQLIAAYLARPFKLHPAKKDEVRDVKLSGVRDTPEHVKALKARADQAGVSHGEAIRQIIHHYIDKGARA